MNAHAIIKNLLNELPRCGHRSPPPSEPGRCPSPATRTFVVLKPLGPDETYSWRTGPHENAATRTGDAGFAMASKTVREEWDRCDHCGLPPGVEADHVYDKPIAETVRANLRTFASFLFREVEEAQAGAPGDPHGEGRGWDRDIA